MTVDTSDERADEGQLDVVVGVDVGLVGGAERVGAMRTGGQRCLDDAIGVLANARATPGRPMRGFFGRSGRLGF